MLLYPPKLAASVLSRGTRVVNRLGETELIINFRTWHRDAVCALDPLANNFSATELKLSFGISSWGREAQLLFFVKHKHEGMVELKLTSECEDAVAMNVTALV